MVKHASSHEREYGHDVVQHWTLWEIVSIKWRKNGHYTQLGLNVCVTIILFRGAQHVTYDMHNIYTDTLTGRPPHTRTLTGKIAAAVLSSRRAWWWVCGLGDSRTHWTTSSTLNWDSWSSSGAKRCMGYYYACNGSSTALTCITIGSMQSYKDLLEQLYHLNKKGPFKDASFSATSLMHNTIATYNMIAIDYIYIS